MISPLDALANDYTAYEAKLRELQEFVGSPAFEVVAAVEQQRVKHQVRVMGELTRIIHQRINYYKASQNGNPTLPAA